MNPDPVNILMILDGWGIRKDKEANAFAMARTPFLDRLLAQKPNCRLACAGPAVGLPQGTMGNSEVGHLNIGAGRTVPQDLVRINTAVKDKSFFENPALARVMDRVREKKSCLHFMGLLSDGGVHSHITHLFALLDMARQKGVKNCFVHPILDGRDTSPKSGIKYLKQLQAHMDKHNYGRMAGIIGRYWAMDRDTRWDRVQKAFELFTSGRGDREENPVAAVQKAYDRGETDEFVSPIFIEHPGDKGLVRDLDGLIFFNFRADRAKEITRAFTQDDFREFDRKSVPDLIEFVCMTRYEKDFHLPVAFGPQKLTGILGEVLSRNRIAQLRIAETEKYAHVTYFFNGGEDTPFKGEERLLIPSPRDVDTYDQKPAMSAFEVAEKTCEQIRSGQFGFVVLNFANMDMVGHTGVLDAAIQGCEAVDQCAEKVARAVWETGGTAFITADHGNSEQMRAEDGSPHTAHTTNPVHFILAGKAFENIRLGHGILGDIAPTILKALGLEQPREMTGTPLF